MYSWIYSVSRRGGSRRRLVVERHARALACDTKNDGAAQQQHDEGSPPDEQGLRFQRGPEANELAVAIRHETEYRIIAVSGQQHFAHLPAKISGEFHIGV